MRRSTHTIVSMIAGCIIGYISVWLIWHMIYGVGGRVIQDWEYEDYLSTVTACGALTGSILGLLCGLLTLHPLSVLTAGQILAVLDFVFSPYVSWQDGLANYSIALVMSTAVMGVLSRLSPRIRQSLARARNKEPNNRLHRVREARSGEREE